MSIIFYDLAMPDDRRMSPYCWRTRMALWHKGLEFQERPTAFTKIKDIADGERTSVPVIEHDGKVLQESFEIALYLEEKFPDRPSLFEGEGGKAMARFIESWTFDIFVKRMIRNYVKDIHDGLAPEDQAYFRPTREKRFGATLEDLHAAREEGRTAFREALAPLAITLSKQPFLGGEKPLYSDYIVFGTFRSAQVATPFQMLPGKDDVVGDWVERCLDLFGGAPRKLKQAA